MVPRLDKSDLESRHTDEDDEDVVHYEHDEDHGAEPSITVLLWSVFKDFARYVVFFFGSQAPSRAISASIANGNPTTMRLQFLSFDTHPPWPCCSLVGGPKKAAEFLGYVIYVLLFTIGMKQVCSVRSMVLYASE